MPLVPPLCMPGCQLISPGIQICSAVWRAPRRPAKRIVGEGRALPAGGRGKALGKASGNSSASTRCHGRRVAGAPCAGRSRPLSSICRARSPLPPPGPKAWCATPNRQACGRRWKIAKFAGARRPGPAYLSVILTGRTVFLTDLEPAEVIFGSAPLPDAGSQNAAERLGMCLAALRTSSNSSGQPFCGGRQSSRFWRICTSMEMHR